MITNAHSASYVAAVSFDSVETLKHFSKRIGITYPLLSDQGSKVIRAFGILDDQISSNRVPGPGIRQPYYCEFKTNELIG